MHHKSEDIYVTRERTSLVISYTHYRLIVNLDSCNEDDIHFCNQKAKSLDGSPIYEPFTSLDETTTTPEDTEALEIMLGSADYYIDKRQIYTKQQGIIHIMLRELDEKKTTETKRRPIQNLVNILYNLTYQKTQKKLHPNKTKSIHGLE